MDVASLVIGLPPLVILCAEVLGKVSEFREYGNTSRQLSARFASAKFRLQDWTRGVGIDGRVLLDKHHERLDRPEVIAVVKIILSCLRDTFDKTEHIGQKLAEQHHEGEDNSIGHRLHRRGTGLDQSKKAMRSTRDAVYWSLRRKAAFTEQVETFEILVDRLYALVPLRQEENDNQAQNSVLALDSIESLQRELLLIVKQSQQDAKRDALVLIDAWIHAPLTDQGVEKHIEARLEGTCDWILKDEIYQKWQSDDLAENQARLLWISGPPGHGKTVLCARLLTQIKENPNAVSAHFFSTPHVQAGCTLLDIIRQWISQLCRLDDVAFELSREKALTEHSTRTATEAEIWDLFTDIIAGLDSCYLVVDGIDEFSGNDEMRARFLRRLKKAIAGVRLRLLITSRPEHDIEGELVQGDTDESKLRVYQCRISLDCLRQDISLYAKRTVAEQLPKRSEDQQDELAQQMADKCEGMFLWIRLQKSQLREGKNQKQLRKIVEKMPDGLTQTYNHTWAEIQAHSEEDRSRAIEILRWACFATRPLTVGELIEAMIHGYGYAGDCEDDLPDRVDDDYINGEIKGLCGSLIEVSPPASGVPQPIDFVIRLIHVSAREFLVAALPVPLPAMLPPADISDMNHMHLAEVCIRYLLCEKSMKDEDSATSHPCEGQFLNYVIDEWNKHQQGSSVLSDEYKRLTLELFHPNNSRFPVWCNRDYFFDKDSSTPRVYENGLNSRLYIAAFFGLGHVMDHLHDSGQLDFKATTFVGATALQAAIMRLEPACVERLLAWGADVNEKCGVALNPLTAAIIAGDVHIIERLLSHGANPNTSSYEGYSLLEVTCAGQINAEIVGLLLRHGANVSVHTDVEETTLFLAVQEGMISVAKMLVENGIMGSMTPVQRDKVFRTACRKKNTDMVEFLVGCGFNASNRFADGSTPLHRAVLARVVGNVRVLLRHGADAQTPYQTRYGAIYPIEVAVAVDNPEIAKLLIGAGATMDVRWDPEGGPLPTAIRTESIDIVDFLIDQGADLNLPIFLGHTPFEWIAYMWPTHPKLSQWRSQISTYPGAADRTVCLKKEICTRSQELLGGDVGKPRMLFDYIGHAFKYLGVMERAMFAFEQTPLNVSSKGYCRFEHYCNSCRKAIRGSRYVCKKCPTKDYCSRCHSKVDEIDMVKVCMQHGLLEVTGIYVTREWISKERARDPEVRQWLEDNLTRYGGDTGEVDVELPIRAKNGSGDDNEIAKETGPT